MSTHRIRLTVNGEPHDVDCDSRRTLADVLRRDIGLTGTHLGCEHGVCGACTIVLDGQTTRSCLVLGAQVNGAEVRTVEGLAPVGELNVIQEAMSERHGLQCGFCTPGLLMSIEELLAENPSPTEADVRGRLSGHLCRCTGYQFIVDAVLDAAERRQTTS